MTARLLVVLLEGVGVADRDPASTPFLTRTGFAAPLHRTTAAPPAEELLAGGLVAQCRDLGLQVEQRSIVLRPSWRGDAAVLQQLGARPRGPADITFLRLVDVSRTAAETGCESQATQQAFLQVDTRLGNLTETLTRGGTRPDVALLCIGPMLPTPRTFDPVSHLQTLPDVLRRQLRWRMTPGALRVRCDSFQAEAHLRSLLARHPFDGHGELARGELTEQILQPGELLLLAAEQVSFGRRPVRARLPCLPGRRRADGVAMLPWMEPGETSLTRVARNLLTRAGAMAEAMFSDVSSPSVAAAPDIDAVLEHDPLHVVEH